MRIRHLLSETSARRDTEHSANFFLKNATSFLTLRPEHHSRYNGWFLEDTRSTPSKFTKLLEHIRYIKGENVAPEPVGITVAEDAAFWEYGDGAKIGFQLAPQHSGLLIRASRPSTLELTLDIRDMYQIPEFGRDYQVTRIAGGVVVKYTDSVLDRTVYLHVSCHDYIETNGTWQAVDYPWDAARNSTPSQLYTYTLGQVTTDSIALGAGHTPEEAQAAAHAARRLPLETVGVGVSYAEDDLNTEILCAKASTRRALDWLRTPKGTYAGLPWFHQTWSRDELIAALGMDAIAQREIIQRYITYPLQQGELPTFTGSGTSCADGIGWLALLLREHGVEHLSTAGKAAMASFFSLARTGLNEGRKGIHGLINSGYNATWMDTIGRDGYRLDIQCMYGLLLEVLGTLSGNNEYEEERKQFNVQVREHFFHDGYLWDGLGDATKRANVFLAYLLQPDLLTEEEWKSCFSTVIAATSTPWGGLTSLDRSHPAFQPESTGQNNLSYHNGDSWFFVNNLAATALHRCDAHVYAQTINRILRSSTDEILWQNFLGQPGEIASADSGTSWGCGIQAFSAGAYLFLLNELAS